MEKTVPALISTATDLVRLDGNGINADDIQRQIMVRATMDLNPDYASEILCRITDVHSSIQSIINWIDSLPEKNPLKKLQGLIDILSQSGKLHLLVEEIHSKGEARSKDYNRPEVGCNISPLLDLAAEDQRRLHLLFAVVKDEPELVKSLLRVGGTARNIPGRPQLFYHGMLRAAALMDNRESTYLLLDQAEKTGLEMEMFKCETLTKAFSAAANNGDAIALKKIIALVKKAEINSPEISRKIVEYYSNIYNIPQEGSNAIGMLLIGGPLDALSISNLQLAFLSGDAETRNLMLNLLQNTPGLLNYLGKALHTDLYKRAQLRKRLAPESLEDADILINTEYQVPHNMEDFIEELMVAAQNAINLQNFLIKIFGARKNDRGPTELTTETTIIHDLPTETDRECFHQLIKLMNLIDNMNRLKGKGIEWARILTILFNNEALAKDYLRAAMEWAMQNQKNAAVWNHLSNPYRLTWPENLITGHPNILPTIDAIEVAMNFDFPTGTFDTKPWRELLISHPESARHLIHAQEIEKHLKRTRKTFPQTIEDLRKLVLELKIKECGFKKELADRLRSKLNAEKTIENRPPKTTRMGVLIPAILPVEVIDAVKQLCILGVLPNTAITNLSTRHSHHEVILKNGIPRQATRHEDGDVKWPLEDFQVIIEQETDMEALITLGAILNETGIFPNTGVTIEINEELSNESLEVIKQLCVSLLRLGGISRVEELTKGSCSPDSAIDNILKARNTEDLLKIYAKAYSPIEIFNNIIRFKIDLKNLSPENLQEAVNNVHTFYNWAKMTVKGNENKAVDPTNIQENVEFSGLYQQLRWFNK